MALGEWLINGSINRHNNNLLLARNKFINVTKIKYYFLTAMLKKTTEEM